MLFIDEIHRLSPVVEEILYPALEDFQIDIMIGEGPAARSIKLDLPPFTLVGATTRAGMLTNPLRDRFGIVAAAGVLHAEELTRIVRALGAASSERRCDADGAARDRAPLARHAAHRQPPAAPRARLRRRCKAQRPHRRATSPTRRWRCSTSTRRASTCMDRKLLRADHRHASTAARSASTTWPPRSARSAARIEDVIEPYLIQQGYLLRTPRGRMATREGLPPPRPASRKPGAADLFANDMFADDASGG